MNIFDWPAKVNELTWNKNLSLLKNIGTFYGMYLHTKKVALYPQTLTYVSFFSLKIIAYSTECNCFVCFQLVLGV